MNSSIYVKEIEEIRDQTLKEVKTRESEFCQEIESIWLKLFGRNKIIVSQRYESIRNHITELYNEMLEEERENLEEIRDFLEALIVESEALKKELALNITIPFEVDVNGIDLKQQKENVENFLEKYKKIKSERISLLENYAARERELCSKIGIKPLHQTYDGVPSEVKLGEINIYLNELNKEVENRTITYLENVVEIENLMNQLELQPTKAFEKQALDTNNEFHLSDRNMEMLNEWKIRLLNQLDEETRLITELQEKIGLLWDRLDVDADEREYFITRTAKKCGKSVVEQFKKELSRCEELKKVNIETVILRLRDTIVDLWDKCHISVEERNNFTDFRCRNFNEELLESHERKVEGLNIFHKETSVIYESAERWFELWNKMISLEDQSNNAERLNNRGGQLLKEEKERKRIQKELPKVETKLEKLVQKFETTHGRPFLYDGIPLMTLLSNYWDNRRLEKENEKEVRKIQNATKLTPMKSCGRIQTPVSSALACRKRARPVTPVDNVVALKNPVRRELKMTKAKTETINRRISRSQESIGRCGSASNLRAASKLNLRSASNSNLRSASANSSVVSYAGFQNYIETKSRVKTRGMPLRSSPSNIMTPDTKRRRPIIN